ncbi:hypothetical protein [Microseira wollei]|uniref:Uncharacterized protein n=1 Tax=Microseira wollei NIES-4236 TaxID=2530354 RepID=A0AAV3XG70_9CYAN|nr:hypothetical protein [Microseira wollei]GET39382.1 hypothetical protein MiSe_41510 [Microseira wollei NIES-4236]
MTEAATINTQLIDTLTQIILALTDEERHILIHKVLTPNQASDTTNAEQETLKQEIAIGAQQLQTGQFTEYDDTSVPNLFLTIKQRGQQRLQQE